MKLSRIIIVLLCMSLAFCFAVNQAIAAEGKITVLNPLGTPPPIEKKQMADRLDTLDGKTIYMINTGFPNSGRLLEEVGNWFKASYPSINIVMARGGMTNIPQNVMTEIGEKADGVILGVGH